MRSRIVYEKYTNCEKLIHKVLAYLRDNYLLVVNNKSQISRHSNTISEVKTVVAHVFHRSSHMALNEADIQ